MTVYKPSALGATTKEQQQQTPALLHITVQSERNEQFKHTSGLDSIKSRSHTSAQLHVGSRN